MDRTQLLRGHIRTPRRISMKMSEILSLATYRKQRSESSFWLMIQAREGESESGLPSIQSTLTRFQTLSERATLSIPAVGSLCKCKVLHLQREEAGSLRTTMRMMMWRLRLGEVGGDGQRSMCRWPMVERLKSVC